MPDVFDALAHPARRQLAAELRAQPARAGDLGSALGISREAISKHLRVMAAAGLVRATSSGRERWYALDASALMVVDDWLTPYRTFWEQRLDALETEIARGRPRPAHRAPSTGGISHDQTDHHTDTRRTGS